MKSFRFGRCALSASAAVAFLAACGGSPSQIAAPGTALQSPAFMTHATHRPSWMLRSATGQDLLYVTDGEYVKIYTYPQDQFVVTLGNFGSVYGMCTDTNGDVFIPEYYNNEVLEYAHGGTSPIATINTIYNFPTDCSVDPTTGNLAVTVFNEVEILKDGNSGWSLPSYYTDSGLGIMNYCGYDNSGNLFVDGYAGSYQLAELPAGSSTFTNISLTKNVKKVPYGVLWDGTDIVIASGWRSRKFPTPLYRYSISGSVGTLVGITKLRHSGGQFHAFWLQDGKIIGTSIDGEATWNYPQGGLPTGHIRGVGGAVTVSVGSSR
jgi:hypothetical protein